MAVSGTDFVSVFCGTNVSEAVARTGVVLVQTIEHKIRDMTKVSVGGSGSADNKLSRPIYFA